MSIDRGVVQDYGSGKPLAGITVTEHGTGIAVRVLVIDKMPGEIGVSTINRGSVGELFAALPTLPPRAPLRDPTQAAAPRPKLSLFRSVKTGPARPVIVRAAQTNEVRPVAYEVLAEPAAMGDPEETIQILAQSVDRCTW